MNIFWSKNYAEKHTLFKTIFKKFLTDRWPNLLKSHIVIFPPTNLKPEYCIFVPYQSQMPATSAEKTA